MTRATEHGKPGILRVRGILKTAQTHHEHAAAIVANLLAMRACVAESILMHPWLFSQAEESEFCGTLSP